MLVRATPVSQSLSFPLSCALRIPFGHCSMPQACWGRQPHPRFALANMITAEEKVYLAGACSRRTETGVARDDSAASWLRSLQRESARCVDSHGSTLATVGLLIKQDVEKLLKELPRRPFEPHPKNAPLPSPPRHEPVEVCMPVCTV